MTARVRSIAAFAGFAAGLLIARELPTALTAAWAGLGAVFAAAAVLLRGKASTFALVIALLGAGGATWSARVHDRAPDSAAAHLETLIVNAPEGRPVLLDVEGIALQDPELVRSARGALTEHVPPFMRSADRQRVRIAVRTLHTPDGPRPASGVAIVQAEPEIAIRAGDRVRVLGRASIGGAVSNPGTPDFSASARVRGDSFWLDASDPSLVRRIDHPSLGSRAFDTVAAVLAAPRRSARAIIDRATDDDDAGALVRGLLLGEREQDGPGLAGAFQRIGLAHLLSVSGFHVAVMAFVALFVVRATGDRGWVEPALVALAIVLYMLVVPVRAPILRAGAMVVALLVSDALGRRHDRLALLAWVGVAVLVWRPTELWTIGFQLSFGLVAWLLVIAEPRPDRPTLDAFEDPAARPLWRGALAWLADMARATAACWSVSIPLVLFHTGALAPLAVAATLITVPLIVLTMWLGFTMLLLGLVAPPLIEPIAVALGLFAGACTVIVRWFDTVPIATVYLPAVSLAWTVFATGIALWLWRRGRLRSVLSWLLPAFALAWLAAEARFSERLPGDVKLRATMLDVGNGTAIVVESGADAMLWDCGSFRESIGARTIPNACRAIGAPRVRTVVITHANIDHFMGLLDIASRLGVREVVTGESFVRAAESDGAARAVLDALRDKSITHRVVSAGDSIDVANATLEILHPPAGFVPRQENDASLVARVVAGDSAPTLLLTGDIQDEAMAMLMESGTDLSADVIELPHHGSARDAAYEFVREVNPSVVLQSTGIQRLDDPRWDSVREDRVWLATPRHGAVQADLLSDGTIKAGPVR
ncbi:MAG: ComEC/Rec2 family competence protein [Planctomycetota bacterium]